MGCGAFTVIWPYDEVSESSLYSRSKKVTNSKKERSRVSPLVYFYFFILEAWALWAFYYHHIKHQYQMLGCDYLNSIRKSWLLDKRFVARFEKSPAETHLRVQKKAICKGVFTCFADTAHFAQVLHIRYGVVGNISACHADARGSIPRFGVVLFIFSKKVEKIKIKTRLVLFLFFHSHRLQVL